MTDCCEAWRKAQFGATNPTIHLSDDSLSMLVGIDLPQLRFCPWCGHDHAPPAPSADALTRGLTQLIAVLGDVGKNMEVVGTKYDELLTAASRVAEAWNSNKMQVAYPTALLLNELSNVIERTRQ